MAMSTTRVLGINSASLFELNQWSELLREYSEECSIPIIGEIEPQRDVYQAMEDIGVLKCFAAFVGYELIGFATVLLPILPHYGRKVATVESIFLRKRYRGGMVGAELMLSIEAMAKENGCSAILYSAPVGGNLEAILSRRPRKYKHTNSVFCRNLA